jgi:hypothetical protein
MDKRRIGWRGPAIVIALAATMAFGAGCTAAPTSTGTGASTVTTSAGSATASPAVTETSSMVPTSTAPDTSGDGKHIAFIQDMKKNGANYDFVLDYAQLLTGDAAYKQGATDGVDVENDYYIRNVNKKLRTVTTAGNVAFVTYGDDPTKKFTFKVSDFYAWRTSSKKPSDFDEFSNEATFYGQAQGKGEEARPFFFTVKNGVITKMEFFWTP